MDIYIYIIIYILYSKYIYILLRYYRNYIYTLYIYIICLLETCIKKHSGFDFEGDIWILWSLFYFWLPHCNFRLVSTSHPAPSCAYWLNFWVPGQYDRSLMGTCEITSTECSHFCVMDVPNLCWCFSIFQGRDVNSGIMKACQFLSILLL